MVIDLHVHTNVGSDDSIIDPSDIIPIAKSKGLDGVCITEHGVKRFQGVEELSRGSDFLILAGIEASTELGDVLVFGIDSFPRTMWRAADLSRLVKEAGGAMIAAHPFRGDITRQALRVHRQQLTIEQACSRQIFQLVEAMEVANGWTTKEDVNFCCQVSQRLGLKGTGSSDAHMPAQIGCCVTVFDNTIRDEQDLITELKMGRFRAEDRRTEKQKNPLFWCL